MRTAMFVVPVATGADSPERSPALGVAWPDLLMRAATITCFALETVMPGAIAMLSSSLKRKRQVGDPRPLDRERHPPAAGGAGEHEHGVAGRGLGGERRDRA